MAKLFIVVISWALSTFLLKLATTLGIAVLTYQGLIQLVEGFLDLIEPTISGLPADVLNILAMSGVPEGLTIIGSAMLTRAAVKAASAWVGVIT